MSRPFLAHAVPMVNDPNGFQNLAWGATLTTRPDLEVTTAGPHVNEFQSRNGAAVVCRNPGRQRPLLVGR